MLGKKDVTNVKINSMLGKGSDFQGDFTAEGSARVDGNVNGNVRVTGTLIVGSGGKISGSVEAQAAVIGGEVLGGITAPEKTELTATAKVLGDVSTKVIVIDEHAVFQGRCDMNLDVPEKKKGLLIAPKSAKTGKKSAKAAIAEALKEAEEEAKRDEMEQQAENVPDAAGAEIAGTSAGTESTGTSAGAADSTKEAGQPAAGE